MEKHEMAYLPGVMAFEQKPEERENWDIRETTLILKYLPVKDNHM